MSTNNFREIPDDIHTRLACAIDGTHLLGVRPLAEVLSLPEEKARALDEVKTRVAPVEIPEGMHQKLLEAMGDAAPAPKGFHERLARAACR